MSRALLFLLLIFSSLVFSQKANQSIEVKEYVLENSLKADFALIKAETSDRYGKLTYNKTARNFNPIMCMSANQTIVPVKKIEKEENTDPEKIITPGIFVNKVTVISDPIIESIAIDNGETYP